MQTNATDQSNPIHAATPSFGTRRLESRSAKTPIAQLALPAALFEKVQNAGFKSAEDLAAKSKRELSGLGFSATRIASIGGYLRVVGLSLAEPVEPPLVPISTPRERLRETARQGTLLDVVPDGEGVQPASSVGELLATSTDERTALDVPDFTAESVFDALLPRRSSRTKKPTVTDDERASRSAARPPLRNRPGPRLNNPDDAARIADLKQSFTMEVEDAAWILGISRDLAYKGCAQGSIPSIPIGKRIKVNSSRLFQMLGPDPLLASDETP